MTKFVKQIFFLKLKSKARQFVRLIELAGWSQAETARRLEMTPGAVSQICNGKTEPRGVTLQLLKVLAQSTPAARKRLAEPRPGALANWELDLLRSLREISPRQRDSLLSAFGSILKTVTPRKE